MANARKTSSRKKPPRKFDENPSWSATDFARARPASDVVPEIVAAAKRAGRPKSENPKVMVSMRLDADILHFLKDTGKGWQSRANQTLARYVIEAKHGSARISTLRRAYGGDFARGIRGDKRLSEVLDKIDELSLNRLRDGGARH